MGCLSDYFPIGHLDEWLDITPGGRICWNITLRDDVTFDLQGRNRHEYIHLRISFYTTSGSRYYSVAEVIVVEDEKGKKYEVLQLRPIT